MVLLGYAALSILHAAFAISILGMPDAQFTLTLRRQFDDWGPLLDLYRSSPIAANASDAIYSRAMELSWCAAPLPPGTIRAPYCACVARQHAKFSNVSLLANADSARDEAVMGLVSCLSSRPVWRVWPVWGVHYGTPATFAFFVAACFLWVAASFSHRWTSIPIWTLTLGVCTALFVMAPVRNGLWVVTVLTVSIIIEFILLPGMQIPAEAAAIMRQEQLGDFVRASKIPSCFWWCEYLCAPVFALYIPLMHCGRDIVMTGVVVMLGGAVGGLGLRSFWFDLILQDGKNVQFKDVMQRVVWLGILASSVTIATLTAVYYDGHSSAHFAMGSGSIALMALTAVIGLMQWPGVQKHNWILVVQSLVALTRNIALFGIVSGDLIDMHSEE
jgi:hypothetical protein